MTISQPCMIGCQGFEVPSRHSFSPFAMGVWECAKSPMNSMAPSINSILGYQHSIIECGSCSVKEISSGHAFINLLFFLTLLNGPFLFLNNNCRILIHGIYWHNDVRATRTKLLDFFLKSLLHFTSSLFEKVLGNRERIVSLHFSLSVWF